MKRRAFTWPELLIVLLVIVVLLVCVGFAVPGELIFYMLFGWVRFLWRVGPEIRVEWGSVALATVALAMFAAGSHALLGWFYRASRSPAAVPGDAASASTMPERVWKMRWSAALVVAIVLMFVTGISLVGITHQIVWLATSDEPIATTGMVAHLRMRSSNNLKQMALGLQNHHDVFDSLPPGATMNAEGRLLHSWQTAILPYVEHKPLWKTIDRAKAWNDPANKPAMSTQVHAFHSPDRRAAPNDAEGYSLSHYAGNVHVVGGTRAMATSEITDGTPNTLIAGEAKGNFKPWGNPTNWRDPMEGINRSDDGFGSPWPGGANMVFVDGHVQFLNDNIDPKVLRALSTPAGRETIPDY